MQKPRTGRAKPNCKRGTACGYSCINGKYFCSDKVLKLDADALVQAATKATDKKPSFSPKPETRTTVGSSDIASAETLADIAFMPSGFAMFSDKTDFSLKPGASIAFDYGDKFDAQVHRVADGYTGDYPISTPAESSGQDQAKVYKLDGLVVVSRRDLTESELEFVDKAKSIASLHSEAIDSQAMIAWSLNFSDAEMTSDSKAQNKQATDKLFEAYDSILGRKPSLSDSEAEDSLVSEAKAWAKSQGFEPGGVNGFTAEATEAHDVAHPATHRLIGMDSRRIHEEFGSLKDSNGKPSLIPEEALVNAIEHLAVGDSLEASIQNGLRLARVQSRTGTKEEQDYVRSDDFARKVIDLIANKAMVADEFTPLARAVRKYAHISGTVSASGGNFNPGFF